ncbi:hypothetical protein FisN_15Hh124 [Fistulifera solaris]|uniref:Uncharacterized protein n=1 Tax=Fistulifera solaris TaxID=1519565 RepID=A0A1Z5K9N2_FISSO|nr:hypothetical protein FisN_15Hh124 [Fistulifera solaris]|eukprot:GAX22980.1 hypothetical protein FisN_15Hh124 [Fistulifera solaris]
MTTEKAGNTGGIRHRKDVASTKQAQMLRQMNEHRRAESQQRKIVNDYQNTALVGLAIRYTQFLLLLMLVGIGLILYISPSYFLRFYDARTKLPLRNLIFLFPRDMKVKANTPRLFRNYALKTESNTAVVEALQRVSKIREIATDSGIYRQPVNLHAWEFDDFFSQLPTPESQDNVCGAGFAAAYRNFAHLERAQTDMILFCLLALGTHDGILRWNTTVEHSLTRGLKGLAAHSEGRIHSSFLLLPILSQEQLDRQQKRQPNDPSVPPSTRLPVLTIYWLTELGNSLDRIPQDENAYQDALGTFLYQIIQAEQKESGSWVLLDAACTAPLREDHDAQFRRVATDCPGVQNCCSCYDTSLQPFSIPRRRTDEKTISSS